MKKKSTSTSAPARRSIGEGGFFNLRVLIGLVVALAGVLLALVGFGTFSNVSAQANVASTSSPGQGQESNGQQIGQTTVIRAVHSDLSPPLRDQPVVWPQAGKEREPHVHPMIPFKHQDALDPVIQSSLFQPLVTPPAIPGPIQQWADIGKPCTGCPPPDAAPPDTNGAVGKTQYVEMVNSALQVFDKVTGTSLLGPIPINSVWSGFPVGPCATSEEGDPIVVYDRLADRWIISQFAKPSPQGPWQDECIAVSKTGDATDAWYRYGFHLGSLVFDYPKLGAWPDGYYMSGNMFSNEACPRYVGPQAFVFDRAKMLVGDPAATIQMPRPPLGETEAPFLPSHADGILPPPQGDPNHFVQSPALAGEFPVGAVPEQQRAYKIWDFHVDWNHPANTSFSLKASVPAADFPVHQCGEPDCEDPDVGCVPQLGTTQEVEGLPYLLMFRNAYRRFPNGRESVLNNFTVNGSSVAGIRWFELQRTLPGDWTLHQESTYQPDSTWRWMGSIASDNQGNIALGFSASSKTIKPQIRYAGRLATDPLNILTGEQHLFDGTGSQKSSDRWGDYSDMTVDPVDDCTFYYTTEYYQITARANNWQTRIGYFRFSECTPPQKGTGHFVVSERAEPLSNALVSIDGMTYGATLADGFYDAVLPPGTHAYAVSRPAFETQTGNFTVTNNQTTLVEVALESGPRPEPTPAPRPTPP
jgi:hypothetical protein